MSDFFIGWSDDVPKASSRMGRRFGFLAILISLIIALLFVFNQKGYMDSYFEFGQETELSGVLVDKPVWSLRVPMGNGLTTVPLVGFGKYGADPIVQSWSEKGVQPGSRITIRGTQFYYKDKRWMELTGGEASLLSVEGKTELVYQTEPLGSQVLQGEIIDPKCFFGVMNPGNEAVHRSCAIRCISGGVPPILGIREGEVFVDYYFLKVDNVKELFPYVGRPVRMSGQVTRVDDWKQVSIDMQTVKPMAMAGAICN